MQKKNYWKMTPILLLFIILSLLGYYYLNKSKTGADKIDAASATIQMSSKSDWDQGTLTNIDSVSSEGSIKMNEKAGGAINIRNLYLENPSRLTSSQSANVDKLFNCIGYELGCFWPIQPGFGPADFTFDLGNVYRVKNIAMNTGDGQEIGEVMYFSEQNIPEGEYAGKVSLSLDGESYTQVLLYTGFGATNVGSITPTLARYVKVEGTYLGYGYDEVAGRNVYRMFRGNIGIGQTHSLTVHTTAPAQIDGGENFWTWDSNTISQTIPASTSVTYRYRTSPNGTDWTDWVSSITSVISRTGDDSNNPTRYRYLQIEASLDNIDGASSPAIDQYGIGYHVEQKPNAPTNGSAQMD